MTEGMLVHIWISLIFPHTMKFTAFIDELVEKKIWSKHGRFKILPWTCNEKIVWIKIYIFFVIIHFSFRWISLSFKGNNFVQFRISSMLCLYKEIHRSYFIGKFRSVRRKLRYKFYLVWIKMAVNGRSIWS